MNLLECLQVMIFSDFYIVSEQLYFISLLLGEVVRDLSIWLTCAAFGSNSRVQN